MTRQVVLHFAHDLTGCVFSLALYTSPALIAFEPMLYTPVVTPRYALTYEPDPCCRASQFPPVHYSTWLSPYDRKVYVQRDRELRVRYNALA